MEKKKKTNLKRKKESAPETKNIAAKLQKVRKIVETMPMDVKHTLSAASDFSPPDAKKKLKTPRSMSAEVQRDTFTPPIVTTKSDLYVTKPNMYNKSPSPQLEPLREENELNQEKRKRKVPRTKKLNADSTRNVSPNRILTTAVHKPESRSPTRNKRHVSPTKMEPGKAKGDKDFAEIVRTRFPLLKDEELMKRFHNVTMTNNQKGRIRQTLKGIFQGTATGMLPDIIYNKIQHLLQSKETLNDSDLRKIRVLYNMLKVATDIENRNAGKHSVKKESVFNKKQLPDSLVEMLPVQHNRKVQTSTGQRYVVFIGNLPLDVDRDQLLSHFDEFRMYIKDLRIPPPKEGKKSAIAYLELSSEPAFEMALSKHHTMFCNRRINVLYSMQQNSKMTKAEAKAKAAKMVALVKSGQLVGSLPQRKKRSHRRTIMRQAQKEANENALMVKPSRNEP